MSSQYAIQPIDPADEERYRRRYTAIKAVVDDLSDALPRPTPTPALTGQESNLLALKVARIQARIYAHHMSAHGVPPPAVQLPEGATWGPLVQNAAAHHAPTAAPPPLAADSRPTP